MLKGNNEDVAIIEGSQHITYSELKSNIVLFAQLFSDIQGQRIGIYAENRLDWVYAFYAIWQNKNTPVPIDHLSGAEDIAFILNDCKPEAIFCSQERFENLQTALKEVSYEPRIYIFEDITDRKSQDFERLNILPRKNETAVIIYTSGTTGSPKGVMLSYDNLISNIIAVSEKVKIFKPEQRVIMLLPLHHIFPLMGCMMMPLYIGGTIVIAPSLNARDLIDTLQVNRVNMLVGVPRLYALIHKGIIDKINQSSVARFMLSMAGKLKWRGLSRLIFKEVHEKFGGKLDYIISGGAPLDPVVANDFNTLGFEILEGYGMTETSPMITFTRPGKFHIGSAGQALPGTDIEIRDGEILARGKNVMQGYYNRPEETKQVLKDGWMHTGDLGYLDKKGRIFITGRKKEIIVLSNGKNINPAQIESKIESLSSAIKECAVFIWKDKLNLLVVPDYEHLRTLNIEDTYAYIRQNVLNTYNKETSEYKKIFKLIISTEELPRTRLSKIQRYKLPELAEKTSPVKEVPKSAIDSKELQTIIDFIAQQIGADVYPEDHLMDDLALDSLSKVTLLVYLENTFGIKIQEEALVKFERIRDLSDYIIKNKIKHQHEKINWNKILKERINFNLPKPGVSFTFSNFSYNTLFRSFFRLKKHGAENVPEGPCIIAPNHQSILDGFLVAASLKRATMRKTFIYAKEHHWQSSFKRFLARKNNVILMDINKDVKESLQKMAEVLRKGKKLIIFPEGTRSTDGEMNAFKQTFAILSKELNIPIVPVAIKGTYDAFPTGKSFPKLFKKVSVEFLKPVYPENLSYNHLKDKVQTLVEGSLGFNKVKVS